MSFAPTSSCWERERDHSNGVQDLHVRRSRGIQAPLRGKILLGFKPPSPLDLGWTPPCIFLFVVLVPCGSCVFDCLVDVWLDLFLSVSPCDFSPFFPVFIVFFEGSHSKRERSAYTGLAPYHMVLELRFITDLESLPSFSSLLLLDFVLNSKIPIKNSP